MVPVVELAESPVADTTGEVGDTLVLLLPVLPASYVSQLLQKHGSKLTPPPGLI